MALHLSTERLRLRPWIETDVDDLRALVTERGRGVPSVATIWERIAAQVTATAQTGIALLPACRRVEGDFIGYCGLIVGRCSLEEPEIAYELFRRAHGRGYATEAARAVLDAASATGRRRLWSTVGSWNTPSLRVLEKLGFERDHVTTKDDGEEVVWLTRVLPSDGPRRVVSRPAAQRRSMPSPTSAARTVRTTDGLGTDNCDYPDKS